MEPKPRTVHAAMSVLRECYAIIITDAATVITYLASFNVPVLGSHHHL